MPRILIVDDEPDALAVLELLFRMEGYEVQRAPDAATALELAHAARPDLVLTDLMMPGIDGLELCARLRADEATRGVPVILSSGVHRMPEGLGTLYQAALPKPVDIAVLSRLVRALLERSPERADRGPGEARNSDPER